MAAVGAKIRACTPGTTLCYSFSVCSQKCYDHLVGTRFYVCGDNSRIPEVGNFCKRKDSSGGSNSGGGATNKVDRR